MGGSAGWGECRVGESIVEAVRVGWVWGGGMCRVEGALGGGGAQGGRSVEWMVPGVGNWDGGSTE